MRFYWFWNQKKKQELLETVNTVYTLNNICPFNARWEGLRNRKKFDLLTEDGKPMQILVENPAFLYFAVDTFYSEINAMLAVIGCCPFHIRVQTQMAPCEAKAPKAMKCTDSLTNSFTSLSCFWL